METIKSKFYETLFVDNLSEIFKLIFDKYREVTHVIITDKNVAQYYLKQIEEIYIKNNKECHFLVMNEGEMNKTRSKIEEAQNFLFEKGISRQDVLIAVGKNSLFH